MFSKGQSFGKISISFSSYLGPPKVQLPSRREPVVAENGEEIVIKAPYSAHPQPKVKWMKNGNEIEPGKTSSSPAPFI